MQSDSEIAVEHVQSETLSALLSIQSHRDIAPSYFDRLRRAVIDAVTFFKDEGQAPALLLKELESAANTLRNEAEAFPGRTSACEEMADWLLQQKQSLERLI